MTTATAEQPLPPVSSALEDPVSAYARRVGEGLIAAGPHVRQACARHLRDLAEGPERGLIWDLAAARWAIEYFEEVLRLNGGQFEGLAFVLLDWQLFVIGSLFGWKGEDGQRRFRMAYIETGKGSGKSPLVAGIGLYGLTADGEPRAEVYAAATKKDQAMILFRDAVAMVDQSPELAARLRKSGAPGREWNLAYEQTASFFRPIASDSAQSGPRPHIALLDEVHEHKDATVLELVRAGTKFRRQALIVMITNSGTSASTVCFDYHDYACQVAAGQIADDSFFGYVCALDERDDPFASEACWLKTNPSLAAGIPGYKYIREQVNQARGMPSKMAWVRRLNFCQWVEAASPFVDPDVWFACQDKAFDPEQLAGRRCWAGLDLASTRDLTALAAIFEPTPEDPHWRLLQWFWVPLEGLAEKARNDRVPYLAWRGAGHIRTLPGAAVDKRAVAAQCIRIAERYDVQAIAYDRFRMEDLIKILDDEGQRLPLQPYGQGYVDMAPAVDELERRLVSNTLRHNGNPCMTWNAANVVVAMDDAGNRKFSKRKASGRIDGMVALAMATGMSIRRSRKPTIGGMIG